MAVVVFATVAVAAMLSGPGLRSLGNHMVAPCCAVGRARNVVLSGRCTCLLHNDGAVALLFGW